MEDDWFSIMHFNISKNFVSVPEFDVRCSENWDNLMWNLKVLFTYNSQEKNRIGGGVVSYANAKLKSHSNYLLRYCESIQSGVF